MNRRLIIGMIGAIAATAIMSYSLSPSLMNVPFHEKRVEYLQKYKQVRDIFQLPLKEAHEIAKSKGISIADELQKDDTYLQGLNSEILGTVRTLKSISGLDLKDYDFRNKAEESTLEKLSKDLYKTISPINRLESIEGVFFIPKDKLKVVYKPEEMSGGYCMHGLMTYHPGPFYSYSSSIHLLQRDLLSTSRGMAHELGHVLCKKNTSIETRELGAIAVEHYYLQHLFNQRPELRKFMPEGSYKYVSSGAKKGYRLFKGLKKKGFAPRQIYSISTNHSVEEINDFLP
ncbi:MAG: hypothetical protein U9R08_04030 [Nanoarchaeota archaeon]|nr:hypothetical protein [Nanoarchaeota archaeon]